MGNQPINQELLQSSKRIFNDLEYFVDTFYIEFIASDSAIKDLFRGVNMAQQREMLKHSLVHIIGDEFSDKNATEVARLGHEHRAKFHVTDDALASFIEALIHAIKNVDSTVSSETLSAWRSVIETRLRSF